MLIPRFSLRWLLSLTTVCAGFFFIVSMAVRGHAWAVGVSLAVGAALVCLSLQMSVFLLAWGVTQVRGLGGPRRVAASPFADSTPPPQILPPRDVDTV